ncbi:MAG: epoxyqueuosine reductase [Desulfomonilaceae bacterium]
MTTTRTNKAEAIKFQALQLGYTDCGIIPVDFYREFHEELDRRSSLFPHSAFFYKLIRPMADVHSKFPWAQSLVVGLRRYDRSYALPEQVAGLVGRFYLVDGRLSFSRERANAEALLQFMQSLNLQVAPTTSLVPARWSAVRAGLGKFRVNNFVYTKKGSWNVIDTWVVHETLDYEPQVSNPSFACPEGCRKCIEACPTGALGAPYTMDATHCISYLTYESMYRPTELPPDELRTSMGEWVYGCDLCQLACPHNAKTWQEGTELFPEPWPLADFMSLDKLLAMDQETFEKKVQPRFWYIRKENIWQWKSNAIRAMANSRRPGYESCIEKALEDPHPHVRAMAVWALAQIRHREREKQG